MTLKQVDLYQTIFLNKVSPFTCMEQKNACYIYLFIFLKCIKIKPQLRSLIVIQICTVN